VGFQVFAVGEVHYRCGQGVESLSGDGYNARHPEEIIYAQGRGEPCGASRGKHMARPGYIVAESFGRHGAQEYSTGVPDIFKERLGLSDTDLEVLRSYGVCEADSILYRSDYKYPSLTINGRSGNIFSFEFFELRRELSGDLFREAHGGCDDEWHRHLVVLRLSTLRGSCRLL